MMTLLPLLCVGANHPSARHRATVETGRATVPDYRSRYGYNLRTGYRGDRSPTHLIRSRVGFGSGPQLHGQGCGPGSERDWDRNAARRRQASHTTPWRG